ncbi:uncharacterized protein LOC123296297 [Chrysoperla carnea]|uniref:uncharacterized protein LOC123296297 n=1 Tax=Chrysoperla carnea TaxID=189513 RepID=UPI001D09760F|nr:uncharacterized protein LOC123296297 [Chrysoperla carnea]
MVQQYNRKYFSGVSTLLLFIVQLFSQVTVIYPEKTSGLRLIEMSVPTIADPRESMEISCTFDMGGEELNSVKWYKDEEEFFRFMPLQHPPVLTFPVAGVHLDNHMHQQHSSLSSSEMIYDHQSDDHHMSGIAGGGLDENHGVVQSYHDGIQNSCTTSYCKVVLRNLTRIHSSGAYKCEISTEAPTFKVVFGTTNVTVIALPRGNPRIEGLSPFYTVGDLITANCTSGPADPPPTLEWQLNGKPLTSRALVGPTTISEHGDEHGLVNTTLALHMIAEKRHFLGPNHIMEIRCISTIPLLIPQQHALAPPQYTSVTISLKGSHAQHLNNQKLIKWPNHSDTLKSTNIFLLITISIFSLSLSTILDEITISVIN